MIVLSLHNNNYIKFKPKQSMNSFGYILEDFNEYTYSLFKITMTAFVVQFIFASAIVQFARFVPQKKLSAMIIIVGIAYFGYANYLITQKTTTIYNFLDITRHNLDRQSFENRIIEMEDVYISNPENLSYLEDLNQKFVEAPTDYYIKQYDYYGDIIDILNFSGKRDALRSEKITNTYAYHIIIFYAIANIFPDDSHSLLRYSFTIGIALSFILDFILYDVLSGEYYTAELKEIILSELTKYRWLETLAIWQVSFYFKSWMVYVGSMALCLSRYFEKGNFEIMYDNLCKISKDYKEIPQEKEFDIVSNLADYQAKLDKAIISQKKDDKDDLQFQKYFLIAMFVIGAWILKQRLYDFPAELEAYEAEKKQRYDNAAKY